MAMLHVLLDFRVIEFTSDETFGVEDGVLGIHSYLILGSIPD